MNRSDQEDVITSNSIILTNFDSETQGRIFFNTHVCGTDKWYQKRTIKKTERRGWAGIKAADKYEITDKPPVKKVRNAEETSI